ncbi:MAG: fused MFS/spermidine synthase [Planctomycetes bacterium]|nr:fused MFS/spermidine synthase [Planctomycetota bacterium]MBL7145329.1 fused MFS/spermidine synthase [Phycisphaerae bacterium]
MSVDSVTENEQISIQSLRPILLALFTLSGAAGLIYEIVWVRELTVILGASTIAVTIILAAFMSGLGIGTWLIGKSADRLDENKLARCFVCLEIGIGLYAIALPWILTLQERFYVGLHQNYGSDFAISNGVRLLLAFLVFIFPTGLMGATLPVLARYIIRSESRISITISQLYALNTLGAVFGTVLAGYFLLPRIGNRLTCLSAAGTNFFIAIGFWLVHLRAKSAIVTKPLAPIVSRQDHCEKLSAVQRSVMWAFAVSGAAAMVYEVAWTRTLSLILGTTTYAFTTMLATFLLGIAIGSVLYGRIRRAASSCSLFVLLQYIIAFSALLTILLFDRLPFIYLSVHAKIVDSWTSVQIVRFILAALVMIVPTIAMGCIFPVASSILIDRTGILGRRLGRAYGLNTLGAVAGATLAGLVLIPAIGMQKAIIVGAFANLLAGSIVCLFHNGVSIKYRTATVLCVSLLLVVFAFSLNPWSPRVMSSGVYAYADRYHDVLERVENAGGPKTILNNMTPWEIWRMAMKQYKILYYNTGQAATVSVMERNDGIRFLTVDGKTDASSNFEHDMKTQVLLGQLPLLFHPDPDRVFVVGLGSGVTVGSVLTHDVRLVDCAEFSKSVIEASEFFSQVNHNALQDKRLQIIPRDARNVLLTHGKEYDVIISQPSNPWVSGQSSLFSLEWYQIISEHLTKGGIFAQWVPAYHMSKRDVKIIVHTLRFVFPHITAWTSGSSGELIFIATKDYALRIPYGKFQKKVASPSVHNDISRLGYNPALLPFRTFAMNEQEITLYLYSDLKRPLQKNTDNLLITEFSTPKQMAEQHFVQRFTKLNGLHGDVESLIGILEQVNLDEVLEMLNPG